MNGRIQKHENDKESNSNGNDNGSNGSILNCMQDLAELSKAPRKDDPSKYIGVYVFLVTHKSMEATDSYKELKEDESKDANEGMMNMFRQIYERSDEKTRRAMIKSFQTSGGTVLSTDWNDVKDKDYEGKDRPEAPKGQEWRKYDE